MNPQKTLVEDVMISDDLLLRLSDTLRMNMGLYFPRKNWNSLKGKLLASMRDFGFEDAGEFVQWLSSGPLTKSQVELLSSHLTIGETYFFREDSLFSALKKNVLPDIIETRRKAGKQIRIWSAGCATGEEPYSVAILLRKLIPDYQDWNIRILATDINPRFLQKARDGIYSKWSFRSTPSWVVKEYFRELKDGLYMILPHIKQMVQFFYLNLAEDVYPSLLNNTNGMDIIFCRNVLMYFSPDCIQPVVGRLYRALTNRGVFIVSAVETSQVIAHQFTLERHEGTVFYRKRSDTSVSSGVDSGIMHNRKKTQAPRLKETIPKRRNRTIKPPEGTKPSIQSGKRTNTAIESNASVKNHYEKAVELYTSGSYPEAEESLAGLLNKDNRDPKALLLMARIKANQGNLDKALNWCEKALHEDKLNPVSHYLHALILEEQGKEASALKSLKRSLYLDPSFALAHFSLGNLALKQGKQDEVDRHFMNTMGILSRLDPNALVHESEGITAARLTEIISAISGEYSKETQSEGEVISKAPNKTSLSIR